MFAAVVESGSFASAAQRLGTSSGYASKLVAKIESELGVRLLHRTTRALQLTEAGQTYYNRVRGSLTRSTSSMRRCAAQAPPRAGRCASPPLDLRDFKARADSCRVCQGLSGGEP
ncbi:LysR family transcriptional regulator [Ensifer psoraleae]|uniref:LysR family transcriptional regulator n=2 Tax=Sinorhizobium psoraleae TaxID=520838 RepID=A0ABT4KKM3_9HYPH|nr:LysR family transcriptional regulator [Sinorhizobium psoraleae]